MRLAIINWNEADTAQQAAVLRRPAVLVDDNIRKTVQEIIAEVRRGGDDALRARTLEYDGVSLDGLRADSEELARAEQRLSKKDIDAIDVAIRNVRTFHEAQLAQPIAIDTMPGVRCERISHAIDAVGLYVPAGTAPLPSAAIMLAVPAAIAGCPTRILCTPPRPDGYADPAVVTAAVRAGVTEIFKVGGAQAIAAMAYGTASVPKVRKIFGPGNAWVTSAKSLVSADPEGAAAALRDALEKELATLADLAPDALVTQRAEKYRRIGQFLEG